MNYIIAVFRSRNQTSTLYNICMKNGINCAIVNTPREAFVGCGISLQFAESNLNQVAAIANENMLNTFAGFFRVKEANNKYLVEKI